VPGICKGSEVAGGGLLPGSSEIPRNTLRGALACPDMSARRSELTMNEMPNTVVALPRNVAAPRPPNKLCAAPPATPNAPAKPPPFPA